MSHEEQGPQVPETTEPAVADPDIGDPWPDPTKVETDDAGMEGYETTDIDPIGDDVTR